MRSSSRSPGNSPSPSPSPSPAQSPQTHAHHANSTLTPVAINGKQVELLSQQLGYPDFYEVETNAKYHPNFGYVPEWTFSGDFALHGYRDASYTRILSTSFKQQHSFSDKTAYVSFFEQLEEQETLMRDNWSSYVTRKTKEEKAALFKNAKRACECETSRVQYPLLVPGDTGRLVSLLPKRSLRELAVQIPTTIKIKNVLDIATSHNIPFVRAAWLLRIVMLNQKQKNLNQVWTESLIQYVENNQNGLYLAKFIPWCIGEGLVDMDVIKTWFVSKLDDLVKRNVNIVEVYMDMVHDQESSQVCFIQFPF